MDENLTTQNASWFGRNLFMIRSTIELTVLQWRHNKLCVELGRKVFKLLDQKRLREEHIQKYYQQLKELDEMSSEKTQAMREKILKS